MKRGILYLQMKNNERALEDFNRLCDIAEKESDDQATQLEGTQLAGTASMPGIQQNQGRSIAVSKSYFYKAKALKKLNNCNDGILYFEQVIRMCDDQFL